MGADDAAQQRGGQRIPAALPDLPAVCPIFFQIGRIRTAVAQQNRQVKVDAAIAEELFRQQRHALLGAPGLAYYQHLSVLHGDEGLDIQKPLF